MCILWLLSNFTFQVKLGVLVTATALGVGCRTTPAKSAGTGPHPPVGQAAPGAEPRPPIVQPGAPGQASRVITPEKATDLSQVQYTGADIKFMQGMIGHHAQAIEMTSLIGTHTTNDDMKKLGSRISISQDDEIHMMQTWLANRGQ